MTDMMLAAKEYIIDMRDVVFWIGVITSLVVLVTMVVKPVRKTLKDYDEALATSKATIAKNTQAINALAEIQERQSECITGIQEDRQTMISDMEKIQLSLITMARLELDKELTKALVKGFITHSRLGWIEEMYLIYEPHCQNGSIKSALLRVRKLPVRQEEVATQE